MARRPLAACILVAVLVVAASTPARSDDALAPPPPLDAGGQDSEASSMATIVDDNNNDAAAAAAAAASTDAAATADAVRRAKAEVEAAVAVRDPNAAFDDFARKQLADAGWTPEQAAAAATASASSSALAGARTRRPPRVAASSSSSSSSSLPLPPLPAPPAIPPALGVLAEALVAGNDSVVRQTRVRAFQASLRRIAQLNARSGDNLAYGITPFAHLTPAEFRRLYLSAPFEQLPKQAGEAPTEAAAAQAGSSASGRRRGRRALQQSGLTCNARVSFPYGGVTPPSAKDWRNVGGVNYVPSAVRNQQSCGSCAAFTASALLENMVIRKYRAAGYTSASTDVSEQEELDCLAGDGCQGALPYQYLDRAVCRGIAFEAASPYLNRDRGTCPSSASVPRYGSGARAWAEPPATERGVAQAATQGLVAIAMLANNDFMYYRAGVFGCGAAGGATSVNHAIAVVGWNDAVRLSNGATWRVWAVRNSWGASWGEQGYVRMRKDCSGRGALNMYSPGYNTVLVE